MAFHTLSPMLRSRTRPRTGAILYMTHLPGHHTRKAYHINRRPFAQLTVIAARIPSHGNPGSFVSSKRRQVVARGGGGLDASRAAVGTGTRLRLLADESACWTLNMFIWGGEGRQKRFMVLRNQVDTRQLLSSSDVGLRVPDGKEGEDNSGLSSNGGRASSTAGAFYIP